MAINVFFKNFLSNIVKYKILEGNISGFCHFSLGLFMVLWQSPDTPVMSCFHVSARLRLCSSRALSRLRTLFRVGACSLSSIPGTWHNNVAIKNVLNFLLNVGEGGGNLAIKNVN